MFIFWGSKNKTKCVGGGVFYCPACRGQTDYSLIRVSRHFHLYFITLGTGTPLAEYVNCHTCGGQFHTETLSKNATWYESLQRPWECPSCRNQNPGNNDECLKCHRWVCGNCRYDNPSTARECLRCRTARGGAF